MNVHGTLFITAKKWKQPKRPSTERMNKQNEVYPYNGILFGNKKKSSSDTGTNLINMMLSERSQSQRTTYFMIPFILNVQNRQNLSRQKVD